MQLQKEGYSRKTVTYPRGWRRNVGRRKAMICEIIRLTTWAVVEEKLLVRRS